MLNNEHFYVLNHSVMIGNNINGWIDCKIWTHVNKSLKLMHSILQPLISSECCCKNSCYWDLKIVRFDDLLNIIN